MTGACPLVEEIGISLKASVFTCDKARTLFLSYRNVDVTANIGLIDWGRSFIP